MDMYDIINSNNFYNEFEHSATHQTSIDMAKFRKVSKVINYLRTENLTLEDVNKMPSMKRIRYISLVPELIELLDQQYLTDIDIYTASIFSNNLKEMPMSTNKNENMATYMYLKHYISIIALENPTVLKYMPIQFHTQELQLQCMKSPYFQIKDYMPLIEPDHSIYLLLTEILDRDNIVYSTTKVSFNDVFPYISSYIQWLIDNNITHLSKMQLFKIISMYNCKYIYPGIFQNMSNFRDYLSDLVNLSDKYKLWYSEFI